MGIDDMLSTGVAQRSAVGQGWGVPSRTEQVRGRGEAPVAKIWQATYMVFGFIMNAVRIQWRAEHRTEGETPESEDLGSVLKSTSQGARWS